MTMSGWKTKAAGFASIASGVGLAITGLVSDPIDFQKVAEGWGLIIAGLAILGIGHKIEKSGTPSG